MNLCVSLWKYAQKENWIEANHIIDRDEMLINVATSHGWQAIHHVAVGVNHVHFIEELLKLMSNNDLELQDMNRINAFCLVAANGNC